MIRHQKNIVIDRPPNKVWVAITTDENGVSLGESTKSSEGNRLEVVDWQPYETVTYRLVGSWDSVADLFNPIETPEMQYTLYPTGVDKTTVNISISYQPKFRLLGSLLDSLLLKPAISKRIRNIKKRAEQDDIMPSKGEGI